LIIIVLFSATSYYSKIHSVNLNKQSLKMKVFHKWITAQSHDGRFFTNLVIYSYQ